MRKNRRFSAVAAFMGLLMIMGTFCSCSKKSEITAMIPADAQVVVKVDVKDIIENAGGDVKDGVITLPAAVVNAMDGAKIEKVTKMLTYAEGVDLDDIYAVYYNEKSFVVAEVDDKVKVETNLKEVFGNAEKSNGYDCYKYEDVTLAYDGDYLWMLPDNDTDNLVAMLEAAKKANITTLPQLADFLTIDDTIVIAINTDKAGLTLGGEYRGSWFVGNIDFDDSEATFGVAAYDSEGSRIRFGEAFGVLSTDFLRYIPDNAQAAMAIGEIESPMLKSLLHYAASNLESGSEFLTEIDGTIGLAMEIPADLDYMTMLQTDNYVQLFTDSKIILMAHYPQAIISSALSMVKRMQEENGGSVEYGDNGIKMTLDVFDNNQPTDIYMGETDGYLAIANYPYNANSHNSFASKMEGKRAAIVGFSEPNDYTRSLGVDYGTNMALWLDADCCKGEIRLTQTNKKFLEALIEYYMNPKVQQQIYSALYSNYYYDF